MECPRRFADSDGSEGSTVTALIVGDALCSPQKQKRAGPAAAGRIEGSRREDGRGREVGYFQGRGRTEPTALQGGGAAGTRISRATLKHVWPHLNEQHITMRRLGLLGPRHRVPASRVRVADARVSLHGVDACPSLGRRLTRTRMRPLPASNTPCTPRNRRGLPSRRLRPSRQKQAQHRACFSATRNTVRLRCRTLRRCVGDTDSCVSPTCLPRRARSGCVAGLSAALLRDAVLLHRQDLPCILAVTRSK